MSFTGTNSEMVTFKATRVFLSRKGEGGMKAVGECNRGDISTQPVETEGPRWLRDY